jgi:hypothetical protein
MPRLSRQPTILLGGVLVLVALAFAADACFRVCCAPPLLPR